MTRRQLAFDKRVAQLHRNGIAVALAGDAGFETIEQCELLLRFERRMIGDVVGGAHEIIERQDCAAMTRMDKPRGNREILVPVSLAGPQFGGAVQADIVHRNSETLAWARPFHMPPRPRAC